MTPKRAAVPTIAFLIFMGVYLRFKVRVPLFVSTKKCPATELTAKEIQMLSREGIKKVDPGDEEHFVTEDLVQGLPMLREAALHGSLEAQTTYGSVLIALGIVEMVDLPNGLPQPLAAQEGLLFHILSVHRGAPHPPGEKDLYAVLLNPEPDFPPGFFEQRSGTGWLFQIVPSWSLNHARRQAFYWKDCW